MKRAGVRFGSAALVWALVSIGCGSDAGKSDDAADDLTADDVTADQGDSDPDADGLNPGDAADGAAEDDAADGDGLGQDVADDDAGDGAEDDAVDAADDGSDGSAPCTPDPDAVPVWNVLDTGLDELGTNLSDNTGTQVKGLTGVAYGNGVWVAPANGFGEDVVRWALSRDGVNWEALSQPVPMGTTYTTSRIHFMNGKFVFFGELAGAGVYSYISGDGEQWTITQMSGGRMVADEFAWSDELTVIAGHDMDMRQSADLMTWEQGMGIGDGIYSYNDIAYGGGRWVTTVNGFGHVYGSDDGKSWTTLEGLEVPGGFYVEYGAGLWLVYGSGAYYTSSNGIDFAMVTPSGSPVGTGPRFVEDRFLSFRSDYTTTLADKLAVVSSKDGVAWSDFGQGQVPVPEGVQNVQVGFADVAYGKCKYVLAGSYTMFVPMQGETPAKMQVMPFVAVGDAAKK